MSSRQIFARALKLARQDSVPVFGAGTPAESKARRHFAQPKIEPVVFFSLGSEKFGLQGAARQEGPILQGVERATIGHSLNVIFKLPGFDGWMRATAKVAWLSKSGKAGGLKFVDIPGESRRLVDHWLTMRQQSGRAAATPGSQSAVAHQAALPAKHDFDVDAYQIALPVEAIEVVPGPLAYRRVFAQAAAQSSSRNSVANVPTDLEKSVTAPQFFQASISSSAPVKLSVPREALNRQTRGNQPFVLALAALIGMFACAGAIFWHFRVDPSPRPVSAETIQPGVAGVPVAASSLNIDANQEPAESQPSESAIAPVLAPAAPAVPSTTKTQSAASAEKLKKPALSVTPTKPVSTAIRLAPKQPLPTQQIARVTPPSSPTVPAVNSRSGAPVPAATPAPSVAAPANSISERPTEVAVAAASSEKASLPALAPTPSPDSPTGSVEVIPDPYPSIRAPAGASSQGARPVALTIGHLISKVDAVYSAEALRQRISGSVKLHVVVGGDGRIESASVTDGPTALRDAALRAIQQSRYEPTLLGSTPVEAEEDITVIFRIATPSHPAN